MDLAQHYGTDLFTEHSWQYVLYGMGFRSDLRPKAGVFKYYDEARATFAEIRRQADYACRTLPSNRDLIAAVGTRNFGSAAKVA